MPTPASPQTTTTAPRPPRPTEASASFEHGQLARSLEQLVRPARYGGDDSSLGHAQWCTRTGCVSTVARSAPTVQEVPGDGKIAAHRDNTLRRAEARPKRPVPKMGNPGAQSG